MLQRFLPFIVLVLAAAPAGATDDERTRIAQQRRAVSASFDAQERACAKRFTVTVCIDEVRARRRAALAPLRERELQIDDAERQQRATERRAAVAARQRAAKQRQLGAAVPQIRLREPAQRASAAAPAVKAPRRDSSPDSRAAEAAAHVRASQQRQADIAAEQARVAGQLAERAATGKAAAALPVPASSAISR